MTGLLIIALVLSVVAMVVSAAVFSVVKEDLAKLRGDQGEQTLENAWRHLNGLENRLSGCEVRTRQLVSERDQLILLASMMRTIIVASLNPDLTKEEEDRLEKAVKDKMNSLTIDVPDPFIEELLKTGGKK